MRREFDAQARIGRYGKTGLARVAFTPEYNEVRSLVAGWMMIYGLPCGNASSGCTRSIAGPKWRIRPE